MTDPPLLSIMAGKKARPRKGPPPDPLELDLHLSVVTLLRQAGSPNWRWTHIGHGEKRDIRTAAKLKAMGVQRGWPDFIFIGPAANGASGYRVIMLELKRKGERLSEPQTDMRHFCEDIRIAYAVCDNLKNVVKFLSRTGVIHILETDQWRT